MANEHLILRNPQLYQWLLDLLIDLAYPSHVGKPLWPLPFRYKQPEIVFYLTIYIQSPLQDGRFYTIKRIAGMIHHERHGHV